tara:strand:+ start:251 stop:526 length:276 start_codon:yes stop_codon:yes gene_type:complete
MALFNDMTAAASRGVGIVVGHAALDFGGEYDPATLTIVLKSRPNDFLRPATTINISRIYKVYARINCSVDDFVCFFGFSTTTGSPPSGPII